jgi:hypothetical protein
MAFGEGNGGSVVGSLCAESGFKKVNFEFLLCWYMRCGVVWGQLNSAVTRAMLFAGGEWLNKFWLTMNVTDWSCTEWARSKEFVCWSMQMWVLWKASQPGSHVRNAYLMVVNG